ncbi:MAG: hypothetical protein K2N87_14730 [Eubacterium sp.]|nr:hypothetical protein [Eubacterium sp.]
MMRAASGGRARELVRTGVYVYLAFPVLLFFLGWCRWYIGIPAALITVYAVLLCQKEHRMGYIAEDSGTNQPENGIRCRAATGTWWKVAGTWWKIAGIVGLVLLWAGLSGIGGYVWQNSDHPIRNQIFMQLIEAHWPVVQELESAAGTRGLVYYLGYWLPAAVAGKLFGTAAGWAVQYVWAVVGILLMYALLCMHRKKISVWPLLVIIFFSGTDAVGMLLREPEKFHLIGTLSLDEWFGYYQFSSMTTQLFWVFNQAVPAWVLCALVFLEEKPRNLLFASSLIILTSTFPFAGMLPFVLYFMVTRAPWSTAKEAAGQMLQIGKECWKNWGSLQNVLGGGTVAVICGIYLAGNDSVRGSLQRFGTGGESLSGAGTVWMYVIPVCVALAGILAACAGVWILTALILRGWGRRLKKMALMLGGIAVCLRILTIETELSPLRYGIYLLVFYVLEAGLLLAVLYPSVEDKRLFALNGIWLFVIPLILVGKANDFCMRASIPGLFLLLLWSIQMLERSKKRWPACLLLVLLLIGALTPMHEMARTIVNTQAGLENQTAEAERVLRGNNFSGSAEGFFWKYIAK